MKINAIGKRIIVAPSKDELWQDRVEAYLEMGQVISVGEDVGRSNGLLGWLGFYKPNRIKVGDIISYKGHGIDKLEYGDDKYWSTQEDNEFIIGKVIL